MRIALFLGCSAPVRAQNYEMSFRKVAARLGVEVVDIQEFGCCGYPVASVDEISSLVLAARNLALAESQGLDVVCLCSACLGTLAAAAERIREDPEIRSQVKKGLEGLGQKLPEKTRVLHAARFLHEVVGLERIRAAVTKPLTGLKIAAHYGCHYLKPAHLFGKVEDPESPATLDALIEAAGAAPLDYAGRLGCCGGGVLGTSEPTALAVTRKRLGAAHSAGADAMVVVCPFCSVMLEGNQKKVEKQAAETYDLPILFLSQLLGLAMGIDPDELGFKLNRIKATKILERFSS